MARIDNLITDELVEEAHPAAGTWRHLELDGERLGVRVEELLPGDTSSVHHWHTAEEEHVIVLAGTATLHEGDPDEGDQQQQLQEGDHVCFRAASGRPHHIENTSAQPFRFLVFGERNPHDVVVYPVHQVMRVKAIDEGLFSYRPLSPETVRQHQQQEREREQKQKAGLGQHRPESENGGADDG